LDLVFNPEAEKCRWIFAYGSLMWRPGFDYVRVVPARLAGFHRRLCVFSHHYRGTPEKPGLVFGLDRGGSCAGVAYEVAPHQWPQVLAYVRAREMITGVYREIVKSVHVNDEIRFATAVTYAVNRGHAQCASEMTIEDMLGYVAQGHGLSGSCIDYVKNTLQHLRHIGVHDTHLERLGRHLNSSGSMNP
jgi:glutathione-specific gamma-glutamylcyclotransferase